MLQKIINKLNDLRPRQLLMLTGGVAILLFIAIYAAMSFLQDDAASKEANKKAIETVQVVVAKVNIPPRTRIQENMLQLKSMPVDMVPEGVIKNFKDVIDVQVKVSIFAGDILTIQKVFAEKSDEGFIATIPLDSRAVSISVNDITSVAGFAKPGDFVDLLLVEKSEFSVTTNILLQNVQLLSINKDMTGSSTVTENAPTTSTTAINNPSIATFALRPEDVLKIISASKLGEIYMSLRPTKPTNSYVGEMEYTINSINTPPKPEPKSEPVETAMPVIPANPTPVLPAPQIPATPPAPKIEIIQGDQVTQEAEKSIVIMPSLNATSALPAIPSGAPAPVASSSAASDRSAKIQSVGESVSGTPLSNSHVAQSW